MTFIDGKSLIGHKKNSGFYCVQPTLKPTMNVLINTDLNASSC